VTRWQWMLVGAFAFITFSVFVALVVSLAETPPPLPTPTRTPLPTFTPTATPQPTVILMPSRPPTMTLAPTFTPPAPIVTPTSITRRHTVQTGETLASIAEKYGVSVQAIADLNGIVDPNLIEVGQELLIPQY